MVDISSPRRGNLERQSPPFYEPREENSLIDLSSPEKLKLSDTKLDDPASQGGYGLSSRSSGTVIRSPHRRSLAAPKSAAQELFENGISFNISEHLGEENTSNDGAENIPVPKKTDVERSFAERAYINPPHGQRGDLKESLSIRADRGEELSVSHIQVPALGQTPSQSQSSTSISAPLSRSDPLKPRRRLESRHRTKRFRRKNKEHERLGQSSAYQSNLAFDSATSPRSSDPQKAPTEALAPGGETHRLTGASPLYRSLPTHLFQYLRGRKRAQAGKPLDRGEEVATDRELRSVANLRPTQHKPSRGAEIESPEFEIPFPPRSDTPKEETPTRDGVKRNLGLLKTKVAKLDGLQGTKERGRFNSLVNQEWIKGTVGDITEKKDRDMRALVSTPTTTTTGSDGPTSASNPNREVASEKNNNWLGNSKSPAREKPIWTAADKTSIDSLQKAVRSSLLSLTPEGQIVPINISSTSTWSLTRSQPETPQVSKGKQIEGLEENNPRHSTSPTPTPDTGGSKGTPSKTRGLSRAQKPKKDPKRCHLRRIHHRELALKGIQMNHSFTSVPRKGLVYPKVDETAQWTSCEPENNLGNLMKNYPGAYPSHLDVEEGTETRFGTNLKKVIIDLTRKTGKKETAGILDAVREFFLAARCHIGVLASLYWDLTGPIFDPSSEYWLRNAKGEATLVDGVTFVLAIPGAFLGLLAFL